MHRPMTLLAAVLLACCAACSGSDSDGSAGASDTGLRGALGRVAATDETRGYFEYGDVAFIARIRDRPDGERFRAVTGMGFSQLALTSETITDELHLDPMAMDGALLAGERPNTTGLFWGDYDVSAVEQALADRDIPSEDDDGGTRWTSAKDGEIALDGPLAGIARTSELNAIRTADGTFAYAPSRAGVDAVTTPGDETLADDPILQRLAGCLGDVVAAFLLGPTGDDPNAYGVGVRATESGAATEVACVSPDGDAKPLRDRVEKELASGTVPSTSRPWDTLLPNATVDLVEFDAVVRITAKPGTGDPVGRVMRALETRDLAALVGT